MSRVRSITKSAVAAVACVIACASLVPACSLAEGQGSVTGVLDIPGCWSGDFNLNPNFFAGVPYDDALQLRIQSGGDYETFSDGVLISIDNVHTIRGDGNDPEAGVIRPSYLCPAGTPADERDSVCPQLSVSLPPGVSPPGVPITPVADPSIVHMSLYLQRTCQTQDVALYAVAQAALNANGTCDSDGQQADEITPCGISGVGLVDAGVPAVDASTMMSSDAGSGASLDASTIADAAADATVATTSDGGAIRTTGTSTIIFDHLFDADPYESSAAQRLSQGTFHVFLADPREICPGGLSLPRCRGELTGSFSFYFERGRPAQPFP